MSITTTNVVAKATPFLLMAASLHAQATPVNNAARDSLVRDSLARATFAEYAGACNGVAKTMWRTPVCGPMAFIDRAQRRVYLNRAPKDTGAAKVGDIWSMVLPSALGQANTAVAWNGEDWSTVRFPLGGDRFGRIALMVHESFHRIAPTIGLGGVDAMNAHLEELDGRVWLRMELNALSHAITSNGTAVTRHARNAMWFRRYRQSLFAGAKANEDQLEVAEGLAEYTGHRVAMEATGEGPLSSVRLMNANADGASFVRGFAYATGPMLGIALDRLRPSWRTTIAKSRSVGDALTIASGAGGVLPSVDSLARIARTYGYDDVLKTETRRSTERARLTAAYTSRLVDGPVLELRQTGLSRSFDPNALFVLRDKGTVYPTGTFGAAWGKLTVDSVGMLVSADQSIARVAAPATIEAGARRVTGPGWVLELNAGWVVMAGARAGDFVVVKNP